MEDEIRNAASGFAAALQAGDAARAAGFYGDEARLLAPTAELIAGRREIEAYWRTGITLGMSAIELTTLEVGEADVLAVEIGRYRLTVDRIVDRGKYLVLHRRQPDGCWRRSVEVFNPDNPASPIRNEKETP